MICKNCGARIADNAGFCGKCGCETIHSETERALLLGPVGGEPPGAVSLAGPVKTVLSRPAATVCGDTKLLRYELVAEDPAAGIRRDGLLYAFPLR